MSLLSAPFEDEFMPMWESELRLNSVMWGDDNWRWPGPGAGMTESPGPGISIQAGSASPR